jgi:peptidoglycan/xylan/chitin deacetylase (PgdA/CDA1 family)
MWMGVFGTDSSTITASQVLANVNKWVQNGRIVIDHANYPLAARHLDQIIQTIKPKGLQMVTLAEAFPGYMSSDR